MQFSGIDWLIFFAVPVIAWLLGRSGGPKGTLRAYFLASGQLKTTSVAATYFGANLTFTTVFLLLTEEAYKRGLAVFSVPIMWLAGTALFLLCYPRIRPYIEQGMTLHQALGATFRSSSLQKWASAWTILAFVGTVGLEFYGGLRLLSWLNVPLLHNIGIVVMLIGIVAVFTVAGGLRGVALADIWLDALSILASVVLGYFLIIRGALTLDVTAPTTTSIPALPSTTDSIAFCVAMAVIFLPFSFCTLDSWQRLGAWHRRGESPNKWLATAAIALSLVYLIPILIGIAVRHSGIVTTTPLQTFLISLHLPAGLLGLVFAGFVAAILSTADELLNCSSFSLIIDYLQIPLAESNKLLDQRKLVTSAKFYTVVFAVAAGLLALASLKFERAISDLAITIFSGQVVFTVPLAVALFWPGSARKLSSAAIVSMLVAFAGVCATVLVGWISDDKNLVDAAPITGFVVAVVVFIVYWIVIHFSREK